MFKPVEERVDEIDLRLDRLTRQMELADKRMDRMEALWEKRWEEDRAQREQDRAQREQDRAQRDQDQARFEQSMARWEAQREQDRAEAMAERQALNRRMAEISDRIGRFTEDFVAPNIPRIAAEFGLKTPLFSGICLKRVLPGDPSRMREFDYLFIAEEGVIWSESKSTPRMRYFEDFAAALPELPEYFPETRGKPLFPILACLRFDPSAVAFLTARGIYALTLGDDTMVIVNPEVKPRVIG